MTDAEYFNRRNIKEFRANHGRLGWSFEGAPVLWLHGAGARSGEERVSPMIRSRPAFTSGGRSRRAINRSASARIESSACMKFPFFSLPVSSGMSRKG